MPESMAPGDIILPSSQTWIMGYGLRHLTGTAGTFATGDGDVSFTITPEPTTGTALARCWKCGRGMGVGYFVPGRRVHAGTRIILGLLECQRRVTGVALWRPCRRGGVVVY